MAVGGSGRTRRPLMEDEGRSVSEAEKRLQDLFGDLRKVKFNSETPSPLQNLTVAAMNRCEKAEHEAVQRADK